MLFSTSIPQYDLPQSPILIIGFFGIFFTLVLLYFVNRAYFDSPLNDDSWVFLIWFGASIMKKGFNIDVTKGQYMMLYNIMCEHNQMVNPQANPDFDLQTFDNLFQAITMAKETYLKWKNLHQQLL